MSDRYESDLGDKVADNIVLFAWYAVFIVTLGILAGVGAFFWEGFSKHRNSPLYQATALTALGVLAAGIVVMSSSESVVGLWVVGGGLVTLLILSLAATCVPGEEEDLGDFDEDTSLLSLIGNWWDQRGEE